MGWLVLISKISEGVLYKDMVYNKILKKETFENFAILYHTSKMGWGKETFFSFFSKFIGGTLMIMTKIVRVPPMNFEKIVKI